MKNYERNKQLNLMKQLGRGIGILDEISVCYFFMKYLSEFLFLRNIMNLNQ